MSIVAMKKKAELIGNLSHKSTFSITGTRRNTGYIGQTSLGRSLIHTPYRNGAPINYGAKNWVQNQVQIISPANMLYLENTNVIKPSAMSNSAKLETRVDLHPIVDKSNTVCLTYQSNFIERLSKKTVIDIAKCTNDGLYYDASFNLIEPLLITPSAGIPANFNSTTLNTLNANMATFIPFANTGSIPPYYKQFAYVLETERTKLYYTDYNTGTVSSVDLTEIPNLTGIITGAEYSLSAVYPIKRDGSNINAVLLFVNSDGSGKTVILNGNPILPASYSYPSTGVINTGTDSKNIYFWYADSSNYLFYVNSITASARKVIKTSLDLSIQTTTNVNGNDIAVLPTVKYDYTGRMIIMESDGSGLINMKQIYYSAGTVNVGTLYNFNNEVNINNGGQNLSSQGFNNFVGTAYLLGEVYFDNTYSPSGYINMYFVLGDSGANYQPYFIKWTMSNAGIIEANNTIIINNTYNSSSGASTDIYQPTVLSYTTPDGNGNGHLVYLLLRISTSGSLKTVQTFYSNGAVHLTSNNNTSYSVQYHFTNFAGLPSDVDIVRLSNRIQFVLKSNVGAYLGIYEINKNTYTEKRAYADSKQNTCRGQIMSSIKNTYLFSRLKRMTDTTIVKPQAQMDGGGAIPSSEYMYNLNQRMACCITTDEEFVNDRKAPSASKPINTCG